MTTDTQAEIERLRAALAYYADSARYVTEWRPDAWIHSQQVYAPFCEVIADGGKTARDALRQEVVEEL